MQPSVELPSGDANAALSQLQPQSKRHHHCRRECMSLTSCVLDSTLRLVIEEQVIGDAAYLTQEKGVVSG